MKHLCLGEELLGEEQPRLLEESDSVLDWELLKESLVEKQVFRTNLNLTRNLATLKLNSVKLLSGNIMAAFTLQISLHLWCFPGVLSLS